MKKTIWKTLGICLLVLAAAAMLCACGGKKKDISGSYIATYNMKEALNKQLEESGMAIESDVNADFILNLNADNTFSFDIDGAGFGANFAEVMKSDGPAIINSMLEAEGITEDMYETIAAASGYDSYDAFVEDMVGTIVSEMGEDFVGELESGVHYEGSYSLDKNIITLDGEVNEEKGMDQGTLNEDGTISITSKMEDGTELNLTFTKE